MGLELKGGGQCEPRGGGHPSDAAGIYLEEDRGKACCKEGWRGESRLG